MRESLHVTVKMYIM